MTCPACGQNSIVKEGKFYCPSCKIVLGKGSSTEIFAQYEPDKETPGEVYRKRRRKKLVIGLLTSLAILIIISPGIFWFFVNHTSFGFREKVMYQYGFTPKAKKYLRAETSITVVNLSERKPFGFTHSGYWTPGNKNVKLNTASDEVAIHEFAHAWWEEKRKDTATKQSLVNNTIKLSLMGNQKYEQATKRAQWIVNEYCRCVGTNKIDYGNVDDHHFYAYMADFLMGKFKEGSHQLPEFMWKYFDGLFSGDLKVTPCYETQSCWFPQNNDVKNSNTN